MKAKQELIDEVMDNFDFNRVAKVMEALNWTWHVTLGVPFEPDIRAQARKMMIQVPEKHQPNMELNVSTGGLKVIGGYNPMGDLDLISLEFVVAEWVVGSNFE